MKRVIMDDGHTPYIPEEIILDILKRLPVKSLIRFQSVCKHWKNLFQTSSFITDHLRHSHQNNFLLLECYGECDPYYKCNPMHLCFVDRELRIGKVQNAPFISFNGVVRIVNSRNGLLCVGLHGHGIHGRSSFLVYNLATREVRRVHKPVIDDHYPEAFCLGFGFCPILNDYKIVRVRVSGTLFYDPFNGAEVFSLSTGSWKILEDENLENVILFFKVESFTCDGVIFWFGSKRVAKGEYVRLIVSFDMATEVFSLIPMPPIHFNFNTNFTLYENKLGVLYRIGSPESCRIELWVMEEDKNAAGERERWSWTKKYTSNTYPCLLLPRAIWKNEIVCTIIDERPRRVNNIVLINLTTNEFNTFSHRRFDPSHGIFNHVESLVSINNIRSYKA